MTNRDDKKRGRKPNGRVVIGWREWAALPDLGVDRINAKIDTGAKTSAIHAFRLKCVKAAEGPVVEFFLHPRRQRKSPEIFCRAPLLENRLIKSSNGQVEERFVIETTLSMGDEAWTIELTLTNRDAMGYRMLIGRDALANRFLVQSDSSYLLGSSDHRD